MIEAMDKGSTIPRLCVCFTPVSLLLHSNDEASYDEGETVLAHRFIFSAQRTLTQKRGP